MATQTLTLTLTLSQWCNTALMARELEAACTLWAHLALVYKHVEEKELDYQAVSTLLCALARLPAAPTHAPRTRALPTHAPTHRTSP